MKKLLVSATAFTLLTVGYSSSAFAAKNPNDKTVGTSKTSKKLWSSGTAMDIAQLTTLTI